MFLSSSRSNGKICFKNGFLIQTWVWRKKNPFLVTLYDSSSKIYTYMYNSMHLFLHLSRGSIKKTCQASGKTLKSQGFCGPFPAPSFFASKKLDFERKREQKHLLSWLLPRNPGLLRLILYATWTFRGLGWSQKTHSRNLWFPGLWEDLYLKVNHLAFSSHGMHCFSFSKRTEISFIFYDSWNST